MKYLMMAIAILFTTMITVNSTCKATIEKKLTYPQYNKVTLNHKPTYPKPKLNKDISIKDWLNWVQYCAKKYGVDPHFALAVAETESSNSKVRYRFGKMGRTFYGPFGIHKCFLNKWDIDNPFVNTEVGIRALSRYGDQKRALKKYNASFNMAYYKRIKYLESRNRVENVFVTKYPEVLIYKTR